MLTDNADQRSLLSQFLLAQLKSFFLTCPRWDYDKYVLRIIFVSQSLEAYLSSPKWYVFLTWTLTFTSKPKESIQNITFYWMKQHLDSRNLFCVVENYYSSYTLKGSRTCSWGSHRKGFWSTLTGLLGHLTYSSISVSVCLSIHMCIPAWSSKKIGPINPLLLDPVDFHRALR